MTSVMGSQISSVSHTGARKATIVKSAPKATMKPAIRMTNTAGPSPESALARSKPQASQVGDTFRKPSNRWPSPQLGQRPAAPDSRGLGFAI